MKLLLQGRSASASAVPAFCRRSFPIVTRLLAAARAVVRVVHWFLGSRGICGPPGDAVLAECEHPFVDEALPQGDACCSAGEPAAGQVGQGGAVSGEQVVDDQSRAEPEAGAVDGEQSFSQGGGDVAVTRQVRSPGRQARAQRSWGAALMAASSASGSVSK